MAMARDEAEETDAQAVSRIEEATGATSEGSEKPKRGRRAAVTEEPTPLRAKRPKLPPLPRNLDAPVMLFPANLRVVSLGKSVSNVSATLNFDIPIPQDFRPVLGAVAYTVGFLGGYLGEGVQIKKAPMGVDVENRTVQKISVQIPRFVDGQQDQLLARVAALIGGPAFVEELFAMDWPWRLNVQTDIEGQIALYEMQQSLALTSRAPDELPDPATLTVEEPGVDPDLEM